MCERFSVIRLEDGEKHESAQPKCGRAPEIASALRFYRGGQVLRGPNKLEKELRGWGVAHFLCSPGKKVSARTSGRLAQQACRSCCEINEKRQRR